jgi:hypothetical protein
MGANAAQTRQQEQPLENGSIPSLREHGLRAFAKARHRQRTLQDRQDSFRWSAERRLVTDHDDRTFYQNRMFDHKLQPSILRSMVFGREPVFFGDGFFEPDNVLRPLTQQFEKPL